MMRLRSSVLIVIFQGECALLEQEALAWGIQDKKQLRVWRGRCDGS